MKTIKSIFFNAVKNTEQLKRIVLIIISSWLLGNTACVLSAEGNVLSLEYVSSIKLIPYCLLVSGLCGIALFVDTVSELKIKEKEYLLFSIGAYIVAVFVGM